MSSSQSAMKRSWEAFLPWARAQVNNAGQKPYLGWSSFSQQTIQGRERQLLPGRVPPRNRVLAGKSD